MSTRVERIRVGLVAGSLLLLVALAGTYGYARYRAGKVWLNRLKQRSGATLVRETDGYTYSQSLQGKTVFTLHAAKAFQHSDGKTVLHDVVITLYGLREDRTDRVYGSEFEWDENEGVARALGEVQMDLQVPSGVAATANRHGSPATAEGASDSIHVKTSGLVFLRKLGVAATQEQIEFRYKGLTCVAKGAEFQNNPSALHLLADVHMTGELRGQPVTLTAVKADFDRSTNVATLMQPFLVTQERKAHAESAVLHLRHDGSVERAEAMGGVALDAGTMHATGDRLDATMSEKNQPQTAKLSGGVKLVDDNAKRPARGEAGEMRMRFDSAGRPEEITALNKAQVFAKEASGNGTWLEREMRGDQIVAAFHADGKGKPKLQQVHATGSASLRGDSLAKAAAGKPAGLKATSISGDDLVMNFASGTGAKSVRLDTLHGQGHTVLRQTAALGEEHTSSGDSLDVVFAADSGTKAEVASATQVGHVAIRNVTAAKPGAKKPQEVATGNADRGAYDGASERLTLTGGVHIADGGTSLTAESVAVDQGSGDAEAHGNVAATLAGRGPDATHVVAQQAVLHKASQIAEFEGSAGKPARMWQKASQVEAATITLDRAKKTLVARPAAGGIVHSVFAGEASKKTEGKAPSILRVESRLMEYSDALHNAVFSGPVKIDGAIGEVRGQKTTVYFIPAVKDAAKPDAGVIGGALDRVVVSGDVKLELPGRRGTGGELVYKAADGSFVLTGTPAVAARVVDAQQGSVTGASLLFRNAGGAGDSTIVVTGAPATGEQRPQRARIETRVRQKSE